MSSPSEQIVAQLRVGTVVRVTCDRLNVSNLRATVSRVGILGVDTSFSCEGTDGKQYAFFGDECGDGVTILSQP